MSRHQLPPCTRPWSWARGVVWGLALGLPLTPQYVRAAELGGKALKKTMIRVAEAESLVVGEAIPDLLHYIQAVADVRLKVSAKNLSENADRNRPAMLVGQYAVDDGLAVPQSHSGLDGYAIDVSDAIIRMAGETQMATHYAVAHFLELQGIRWYTPGRHGEVVPTGEGVLALPDTLIQQVPSFWSRRPWYNGGSMGASPEDRYQFHLWAVRNRAIGGIEVGHGHMWSNVFRPLGGLTELAKNHPEWFHTEGSASATRNDLCLLHPGVVQLFVDHYLQKLDGEPRDVHRIFSICPDDGYFDFTCPAVREHIVRADPLFVHQPDITDVIVQFVNQVLESLNADYPNVQLCTYVYANFQSAPDHVEPHPNFVPMFAPLNFGRYHHTGDPRSASRYLLGQIVDEWIQHTEHFGWYDYSYLCPDAFMPFTRIHMVGHDLPALYEKGLRYWSIETGKNWPNYTPDYYLAARLSWDVDLDQQHVLDEFYELYFGAAGPFMKAYQAELVKGYTALEFSAGNKEFMGAVFTDARLATLRLLMHQAWQVVYGDDTRQHRVHMFDLVLQQAERFMAMRTAVNAGHFETARRLNEEIRGGFDEQLTFDPLMTNEYVRQNWYEAFYGSHVQELAEFAEGTPVMHIFPDRWPAHLDLGGTGESEGAHGVDAPHFGSFELNTFSESLAEQGLEKYRGAIWYQQKFRAPDLVPHPSNPDMPDVAASRLVIGGVDDTAAVWLDGEPIGGYESGTFGPHLIQMQPLAPGTDHVLTIRVTNYAVNELGTGGIIRPVFLLGPPPETPVETSRPSP